MQPVDRAEIDDNDLANATISLVDRLRPHLPTILATVAAAFVALAAWTLVSSRRDAERSAAWDACLAAVSARDAARLGEVAGRYPGTSAATWSQILLADNTLAEGNRLVFADKSAGRERLQAAADLYAGVMAQRPKGLTAERAVYGLAKAREALGEIDAAKQGYEALVAEYPASPLASLAASRVAALGRPATAGWYDWFQSIDVTPPAQPEPAASGAAAGTGN